MKLSPAGPDLVQVVRSILLRVWDPVGIHEFLDKNYESVCDEYDVYIEPIIEMLREGRDSDRIREFLVASAKAEVGRPSSIRAAHAAELPHHLNGWDIPHLCGTLTRV